MKTSVKNILLQVLYYTGINSLVRRLYRSKPRIIMLHQIYTSSEDPACFTTEKFETLVKYIKANYQPMTVFDLISFKQTNGFYPENAIAITFDDGFKSFYDLAWPILYENGVPSSIFVCPTLIDNNSWIWPDCITYLYHEGYHAHCEKNLNQLLRELKKLPSSERNERIKAASRVCNVPIPSVVPEKNRLMSWDMLKELRQSPLVEVGTHTLTHPILSMEDTEISWKEISGSKQRLEDVLGITVHTFCYPNGHPDDYRSEHLEMLHRADYLCALASHFGYLSDNSDLMSLPRISTGDSMFSSYKYLDGIEFLQRKLLNEL